MDLTKILKPGMKIYSLTIGRVVVETVVNSEEAHYPIVVIDSAGSKFYYTEEGKVNIDKGECILFPSEDYRYWDEVGIEICTQPNRVEKGQDYFFITDLFKVAFKRDRYDETDDNRYRSGNYFSSEEKARRIQNIILAAIESDMNIKHKLSNNEKSNY